MRYLNILPDGFNRDDLLDEQRLFLVYLYANAPKEEFINMRSMYEHEKLIIQKKDFFNYKISRDEIKIKMGEKRCDYDRAIEYIVEDHKSNELKKLDERYPLLKDKKNESEISKDIQDSLNSGMAQYMEYRKEKEVYDRLNRKPTSK